MNLSPMAEDPRTLIDQLLEEQQRLTAVERFSRKHDRGDAHAQSRYYRDLIPLSKPGPGQQYAFAVDLDACTGCKACVSACHSLNGLEDEEVWRNVGLLHGGSSEAPYQQTITTACHHCVEPGCLEGCPVMAYDKDAETGIVRHLDDQCIGCQYCVLKCPYDVPKYSSRLGIVRKCDMCSDRLAVGEAPACVQACPHEAIRIDLVDREEVSRAAAPGAAIIPGAFDSNYTKPTTRFTSQREIPATARSASHGNVHLEHAHWPLVLMLLLTQTGAGIFIALAIGSIFGAETRVSLPLALAGWAMLHAGLGVSVLHLGRPLGAWRFFLGLRTSWMSREILAFTIFSGVTMATVAVTAWEPLRPLLPALAGAAALLGGVAVYTSAMIYIDTRRAGWSRQLTFPKFAGTTLLMGATTAAAVLAFTANQSAAALCAATMATIIRIVLFSWERSTFTEAEKDESHPAHASARAILQKLPWIPKVRATLFTISTCAGVVAMMSGHPLAAVIAFASTFLSQLIERYCFFAATPAPRMPGGVPA